MPLSSDVHDIITEVERLSGRPVLVQEDPALKGLAVVQPARGAAPAHIVRYKPGTRSADYLVAYQLGFVVRLFSCPPESRWDLASSEAEHHLAVAGLGIDQLPSELQSVMVSNIFTQLRTASVGMRIDQWLLSQHPRLRPQQETAARMQIRENERALDPEIRTRFPKALVDTNSAMNAAFAGYWARELSERRYTVPFSALGYNQIAKALLTAVQEIPDEPASDRELIERWAEILGLTGFFHFSPHQLL